MSTNQIGSYELQEKLGEGGMAVVYKAYQRTADKHVAIKLMRTSSDNDDTIVDRFLQEAQIVSRLQHEHILPVLDFDTYQNVPYLVMAYLQGGTLNEVHAMGTIPIEEIVLVIHDICAALDFAHNQSVLHRDIKPTNILFDHDGKVYITDFGLAKYIKKDNNIITATGDILGTPAYMAPEQIDEDPDMDYRVDIYAMGVLTYELLTGKLPFDGSLALVLMGHLQTPPPPPSAINPELSEAVDAVIQRAMAKSAADRYSSAGAFARALQLAFDDAKAEAPLMIRALIQKHLNTRKTAPSMKRDDVLPAEGGVAATQIMPVLPTIPAKVRLPQLEDTKKHNSGVLRDRKVLVEKVQKFWIEGVLEKSLYGAALVGIMRIESPRQIQHPWNTVLETFENNQSYTVPHGLRTIHLFNDRGQALLILGEPGTGKTTTLLELTRDLIVRAKTDASQPIPVVFNLSTWTPKLKLEKWLILELKDKYGLPERIAKSFLEQRLLVLLLDGLDEVNRAHHKACVESINAFRTGDNGSVPMVVTCRIDDYVALGDVKLRLEGALILQKLNGEQIRQYFAAFGEQTALIYEVVKSNPYLMELAQSPLMLNVMVLAYKDMAKNEIDLREDLTAQRNHLFTHYVERMFRRRSARVEFTQEQMSQWLGWVAHQMQQHQQTIFRIEDLQPNWLEKPSHKNLYRALSLLMGLFTGFITGTLVAIAIYFVVGHSIEDTRDSYIIGVIAGTITGLFIAFKPQIAPLQKLRWSQETFRRRRLVYSVVGTILGTVLYTIFSFITEATGTTGIALTILGVIVGLLAGLTTAGIATGQTSETQRPNEGIWRSARYALIFGASSVLVAWIALSVIFVFGLTEAERTIGKIAFTVFQAFLFSLPVLTAIGMIAGGLAVLQHLVLRQTLAQLRLAPRNYTKFLDAGTDLVFLRKVGGGYIFMHRFLLEHFAAHYAVAKDVTSDKPPIQFTPAASL
jgi:serine/threonine protein kinase/DNA polymerase III delta prime subunit